MGMGTTPADFPREAQSATWPDGDVATDATAAATWPSVLDRLIPLGLGSTWQTAGWITCLVVALGLRFSRLDAWALDASEATHAYNAWTLFRGQPSVTGEAVPGVGSLMLLLEGLAFFLFGSTDVVARIVPALIGLVLVAMPLALRRWLGGPAALGIAALMAISPTFVYFSRVVSPEIVVATLAMAAVVCLARLGTNDRLESASAQSVALGVTAGAAFATSPSAISVAITLVIGVSLAAFADAEGTMAQALRRLRGRAALLLIVTAVVTAVLCCTRFLSHPTGIAGLGETFRAWWQLLTVDGGQPVQLYLLALLIYEPIAVLFTIITPARLRQTSRDAVVLLAGWLVAAFALWSFSAGRQPEHAVHVTLPLVMLAGIGLGNLCHAINWDDVRHGRSGLQALAMLGVVVGLGAVLVLLARTTTMPGGTSLALPPVAVLCLVVIPLAYLIWRLSAEVDPPGTGYQTTVEMVLLVLALLLGAFGLRSATQLALYRADTGTELLAQRTAADGTLAGVDGLLRLARDVGVSNGSVRDPTGSHGLDIALQSDVAWPFVWYFREFPDLTVLAPGAETPFDAQVVIAKNRDELTNAGYAARDQGWLNNVPPQYLQPDMRNIFLAVINPANWLETWRYLLYRDGITPPPPEMVAVGLGPDLAQRLALQTGPYDLDDRPGPGTEPGQFKDPIGVAVGPDGVIAVVDSGNARVERFSPDGDFLDVWGSSGDDRGVSFARTANGLGPTGITIGADGQTWVADTWGHRVVALDASGAIVQTIGGETVDLQDDPARVDEAGGRFFGPRAIAVGNDAIYVVDTGNERVQRFRPDGTFVDAWGGYGTTPDRLIEPVGIAIGPGGNVYVADSGNARISIFTPDGNPVAQWPVADWPAPNPGGLPPAFQPYLTFDAAGNLYASASNAGQVLVIDRDGQVTTRVTEAGGEQFAQPVGVTVARDGDVYVSDVGKDAVLSFRLPPVVSAPGIASPVAGSPTEP